MNDLLLWKSQLNVNDTIVMQLENYKSLFEFLLKVVEDHETDMKKMTEEINTLKRKLSEHGIET